MTASDNPTITRRATRTGVPPLGQYLSEAWRYRTFALYWSRADIKSRNFETSLGRVWHFLNPLLFGIIYFIFIGILSGGDFTNTTRLAFIVGNLYVWTYFSTIITTGMGSVQGGGGGVAAQSAIPRVVLPLASTLTAANLFLRSLIAYVPIHIVADRGLHLEMLLLPVLVVITGVFGFGLALVFAVLNVYFRDISRLVPHFLRLWLYLSPAIWAYTRLVGEGTVETLAQLNPMYWGMVSWTMMFDGSLAADGPELVQSLLFFAGWSVAILVIGFFTFVSREDEFAVRN
jgi:ABC-type polysaccharide/polyol phosphate export permease